MNGDCSKNKTPLKTETFCVVLTQKLCAKVPLDFEQDLDVYMSKNLKPQLF